MFNVPALYQRPYVRTQKHIIWYYICRPICIRHSIYSYLALRGKYTKYTVTRCSPLHIGIYNSWCTMRHWPWCACSSDVVTESWRLTRKTTQPKVTMAQGWLNAGDMDPTFSQRYWSVIPPCPLHHTSRHTATLLWKVERQQLFTLKVSSYCLLSLHGRAHKMILNSHVKSNFIQRTICVFQMILGAIIIQSSTNSYGRNDSRK